MLITIGCLLILAGFVLVIAGRYSLPLGRLPGDMNFRGQDWQVSVPLGSSIVLSLLLSAVFYILSRLQR